MTAVDYTQAEQLLAERLSERSLAHCQGVGETAGLLAGVYGVDLESARLAGLLHDWDRDISHDELVESAEGLGLEVTATDRDVPYLLHARTGAAQVKAAIPELPDEVVIAIARHTVGVAEMSDLDMVVYIADMISPDRTYSGVAVLREAVGNVSLSALFSLCYCQSVGHLVSARKLIHPETVAVWNALVARVRRD